jgi:CarboxypepD_reg-like domain
LLLSFSTSAQVLKGVITDSKTGKPLSPVTITNLNTQQSTYNGEDGRYTIEAKSGDRIAFSYVGYKNEEHTSPAAIDAASLDIKLEPTSYQLQQVNIYNKQLTQYQKDSIERMETYKLPLNYQHAGIMSPASLVAEQFSRKAKQTFKFQKEYPKLEMEHFIDTRYTSDLVISLTKLTGDSVGNFMNTYPMDYDFSRTASDLEIKMWIKFNYKQYMLKLSDSAATEKKIEHGSK